jgi:serine/threonine protein kinase/tetratricopeptide (TPR) repeat protein
MGVVYRALDPRLERQVAIKLLPEETARDPQSRERLRREAMAVAAIDHPYICKIFEIGEHGDALFLVMEYIAGQTLDDKLRAGRLPLPEALRLAGEVAEALQEAHGRRFLHRDLKAANVMVTDQGHVKVMDFGVAKRLDAVIAGDQPTVESAGQLTVQGGIVGTPAYMSPEQVKGGPLDARSDLFSFGVMLAQMISGRHPFRRASVGETLAAVLHEPPDLGDAALPAVAAVVRRLLEKDREARYASAAEVRADLATLLSTSGSGDALTAGAITAAVTSSSSAVPSSAAPAAEMASSRARTRAWWKAGVAVLGIGVASYLIGGWQHPSPAATAGSIRSIAVLPLDNYSGDASQDYFAEGMTDEITADLATISQLRVISRGSAMQFRTRERPPTPEIGRRLNVDAVIEGSVSRSGERVRITAQLIDAREDKHLWAETFERSSRDVLSLQAELAGAIARAIDVQLTPTERSRLTGAKAVNPEAHDAYLRGRFFFNRPSDENLQKAIALYEEAVKLSPDFALASSGLSDAYLWAGYNEGFITAAAARPKAKDAAERAVALDNQSAEAHTSLAVFKLFYDYDWPGCEREFRQAFSLNPNYAFAHDQFGLALAFQGRFAEAIAEGARAIELDPLSPQILVDATMPFLFQRDATTAKALARRAMELDPAFFFPVMVEGWADVDAGHYREALPALKRAQSLDAPPFVTAYLAFADGFAGDRAGALADLAALRKMSPDGSVLPFNLALVKLGLGDRAGALDGLEQAYAANSQLMPWIGYDTMFDTLRSEPRFKALLEKVNLER